MAIMLVVGVTWPFTSAYAEPTATQDLNAEADELQLVVEESAAAYDSASAAVEKLEKEIVANEERIQEIEDELPGQLERSNQALRTMYFMQQEGYSLLDMLLRSDSISDFFTSLDYLNFLQECNLNEISRLTSMQKELEATETDLEAKKAQAIEERDQAEASLSEARKARQAAQEKALAEAKAQAEAEARALEAAQAEMAVSQEAPPAPSGETSATPTPVDWSDDKQVFVSSWGKRIDNYLAGSPLAGQGQTFARAAWDYGVDPRWSPAISNTESSKGAHCFLPHNAWGWGSNSWSSWEEAIDAHVRGLARGYGYTISVGSAKKYCPPNWEKWYNNTLAQMNSI